MTHPMVLVHVAAVAAAVGAASLVLVLRKGTARHRAIGRAYAVSLALVSLSSFAIYELRTGPSVFHVVSALALVVVGAGVAQPLWRGDRPRSARWHAGLMQASCLILVITGVAQFFDRLPLPSDAANAIVFLQLPAILGTIAIARSVRTLGDRPLRSVR